MADGEEEVVVDLVPCMCCVATSTSRFATPRLSDVNWRALWMLPPCVARIPMGEVRERLMQELMRHPITRAAAAQALAANANSIVHAVLSLLPVDPPNTKRANPHPVSDEFVRQLMAVDSITRTLTDVPWFDAVRAYFTCKQDEAKTLQVLQQQQREPVPHNCYFMC